MRKEPVMGSHYLPHWETGAYGASRSPWRALCVRRVAYQVSARHMNINKGELLEVFTRFPATPSVAIGRGQFFLGFLILIFAGIVLSFLFGTNLFTLAVAVAASYVWATWSAQRLLDIRPTINVRVVLFSLLFLMLAYNVLNYLYTDMLSEYRVWLDYIAANGLGAEGAPIVSETTALYAQPIATTLVVIGIPSSIFMLYLLLKKGAKEQ